MKLRVHKYIPNFVDVDSEDWIVEITDPLDIKSAKAEVQLRCPFLKKYYAKLRFEFVTFTHTMLTLDGKPYATITLEEL